MNRAMTLAQLAGGLFDVSGYETVLVSGLSCDSREITHGDAFIAVQGFTAHGLSYLNAEQVSKAAIVLYEAPAPTNSDLPANALSVPNLKNLQAKLADCFFGSPSKQLNMVGVTGTNGKTSSVQLIAEAYSLLGKMAGTIGTLGAGLVGQLKSGERTTPDVIAVHRAIADMRDAGAQLVAMEVSSHALDQGRVDEVHFDTAVFSNLTLDHLDYHGSMQNYFAAKAKLFTWPGLRHAVINIDDTYGEQLFDQAHDGLNYISTSSKQHNKATLRAEQIALSLSGMRFILVYEDQQALVNSPLLGRFNVDNLLAVAGVLLVNGLTLQQVANVLGRLSPVGGRMSRLGGEQGLPLVVVDYAHTPDALEQALKTLRDHSQARLICVFGCGGDRDRSKRPLMAAIAEQLANVVWLTDDNPRTESGDAIVAEIYAGFRQPSSVHIQRNRRLAIKEAIATANATDIVLIAGKGHETYQEQDGIKSPFDDRAIAAEYLAVAA
jgi:UDP-N-acetylmuramoyl-L-alanyl-D-glutamate--2,6-diaminopimelate ligase